MAILNGAQPDYYGDFMDSMVLVPDPIHTLDVVAPAPTRRKGVATFNREL